MSTAHFLWMALKFTWLSWLLSFLLLEIIKQEGVCNRHGSLMRRDKLVTSCNSVQSAQGCHEFCIAVGFHLGTNQPHLPRSIVTTSTHAVIDHSYEDHCPHQPDRWHPCHHYHHQHHRFHISPSSQLQAAEPTLIWVKMVLGKCLNVKSKAIKLVGKKK